MFHSGCSFTSYLSNEKDLQLPPLPLLLDSKPALPPSPKAVKADSIEERKLAGRVERRAGFEIGQLSSTP